MTAEQARAASVVPLPAAPPVTAPTQLRMRHGHVHDPLREECDRAVADRARFAAAVVRAEQALANVTASEERLRKELERCIARALRAEGQVAALLRSRSWRVTAPLRALRRPKRRR
jgi:hypothetical protein